MQCVSVPHTLLFFATQAIRTSSMCKGLGPTECSSAVFEEICISLDKEMCGKSTKTHATMGQLGKTFCK